MEISLNKIEANRFNPNVMSADTFEALKVDVIVGDYDPILVSPKNVFYSDPELPGDVYVIIDGEHRWRAAVEAELETVDAKVLNLTEKEARSVNYRRNRERGTIDLLKETELFKVEIDEGLTQEQIAEKYLVSRSYVSNRLRLINLAEPVVKMFKEPREHMLETKKEEIREEVIEELEEAEAELDEEELEEVVEERLKKTETAPRGAISTSHLEAIASLPDEHQEEVAERILGLDLTVRETEREVRQRQEEIEEEKRFEEDLEKALMKGCPLCGTPPKTMTVREGRIFFHCPKSGCRIYSWPADQSYEEWKREHPEYFEEAKKPETAEERKVEDERAKRLKEARANPGYIRRLETVKELEEKILTWALKKVKQLDTIEKVSIRGTREGKKVEISYPGSYGRGLQFLIGTQKEGEYWPTWERKFGFNMEAKVYKTLKEKSKVDLDGKPSPEARAEVHRFLDEIVDSDEDPFLPDDEEEIKKILARYRELKEAEA